MVTLAGGQFRSISRWEVLTKLATLIASCVLSVKHFPLLHFFSRLEKLQISGLALLHARKSLLGICRQRRGDSRFPWSPPVAKEGWRG